MTEPRDGPRAIRVFVSSTFRDMQAEREELVKRVFPQLRKLCESRGVTWGEVDLRWGVTDEQKAEGQVLPICLAEIALCRPYFIGILGERYGWIPDEVAPSLVEQESWLAGAPGRSVTELEILHGVLNNPEMAEHAFFYFRDPAYIDSLPPETRSEFVDSPELARRLQDLKQRIRGSRFPVRESYPDPRSLGELVLEDMRRVVDRLYPAEEVPGTLDREAAEHEAFLASRAGVYIGREDYFRQLDAHAASQSNVAILGASGGGKSALLANWVRRYRERQPSDVVIPHFIGASAASTSAPAIQRRLIGELNRRVGLEVEIPDSPDALHAAFANALNMAAARRAVTIVIDALDQLEDVGNALDVGWLPARIPDNIRLICSTLPGRSLDQLKARGFAMLDVEPLRVDERIDLIEAYLAQYRKALSVERAQRIATAAPAGNPLFLRAMLEELRVWGDHLTLDAQIEHYLSSATIEELYQKILGRWERDFERERPGLVGDAASLIWAARRGLSEAELLDLLGGPGGALPQAIWSPLFLAAESSLVLRSGLINFFHQYLREAVRRRYLPDEERERQAHLRLAGYFGTRDTNPRKVEELPWQLASTQAWPRLYDLLADFSFFTNAWETNDDDVKTYWAQIERESPLQRLEAYRGIIENPADHNTRQLFAVAQMLENSGHLREALRLLEPLAAHYRRAENAVALERTLGLQARTLYLRGELDAALALYEEQESLCRTGGRRGGLSGALGGRAGILTLRGKLREGLALHEEAEAVCREAGDKDGLQVSLGNQAGVLFRLGEVDKAAERNDQKELLCRELGSKSGLADCLRFRGGILARRLELDRAIEVLKEDERICRELGDKEGLQTTLGLQALVHKKRKDYDRAIACFREKQRICLEMGNMTSLATALANEAAVLIHSSPAEALARAEEATQIAEARGLTLLVDRFRPILERSRKAAGRGPNDP